MDDSRLSARTNRMPASGIREIFDAAQQYDDLADLSLGEPDMTTPEPILDAVDRAVREGATHYTPTVGRADLRRALADKLAERNGITADPDSELLVTPGAMGALFCAVQVLVDPGNEVLVPAPYWSNYAGHVASAGGTLIPVPTEADDAFVPSPDRIEAAMTADTALVLLNTPTNPTGAVVPAATLERIGDVAAAHDVRCLLDETYEALVYDDAEHHSLASAPERFDRTVTVHSFSKAYAMTGWRVGYASGPADVIDGMRVLQEHTVSCVAEPAQIAARAALDHEGLVAETRATFDRRRGLMLDGLERVPGISPGTPSGAFYVFADVTATGMDSRSLVLHLLDDEQVAAVPGSVFGDAGEGYLRFSYATDEATIGEGIDRLRRSFEAMEL